MSNTIGKRVKEKRKQQGYTLEALAAAISSTKSYLSEIENGHTVRPSASTVYRLAHKLGVTMEYLMGLDDLNGGLVAFNQSWDKLDRRGKSVTRAVIRSLLKNQDDKIQPSAAINQ